ncbi:MAG: hypothetical protein NTW86_19495 [Candidatus Sumerlaeota bacterium]|nr:hypothetical protein [Candidatus Sumerlaeota bacterium]
MIRPMDLALRLVLLSLAAPASGARAPEPAPPETRSPQHPGKPAMRLYAIASGDNSRCTEDDLRVLAEKFQMVYGGFSREQMDAMRGFNPQFKVLQYVGTFSTNTTSKLLPPAEAEKRRAELLHYPLARLAGDVSIDARRIRLEPLGKNAKLILKPSAADGEFSVIDPQKPESNRYVTWLRIDEEFLRVNGFDPATGEVEVQRGFSGSRAAAHKAGAPVLHPVYQAGNAPGIEKDEYGRPPKTISYIPDPAAPLRWDLTFQETLHALDKGYDGAWIDCLGSKPFNPAGVDGNLLSKAGAAPRSDEDLLGAAARGRALPLWSFAEGRPYTEESFRVCCEKGVTDLQSRLEKRLGKCPTLYANNIGPGYFPDQGGRKFFLTPTEAKPRPLDGYCLEGFAGTLSNADFSRWFYENGPPAPPTYPNEEHWQYAVRVCMDAAQDKLAICPMISQAGWKTMMLEALPLEQRNQFERFAYASYLMSVERDAPAMLGMPAFYVGEKGRYAHVDDLYFQPIGDPAESRKPDDIEGYRVEGHKTYLRRFGNGVVLVNPTTEADADVPLSRLCVDPETRQTVSSTSMKAQAGRLLLFAPLERR